jgi:hypothetical protein
MSLKVVGVGLGRTGTLSLKVALEQLGFGPCYHMTEVMLNPQTAPALWIRAADGDPDWESIFNGYAATVDYPGCRYWRELARAYPDAKVLLSLRDPHKWFESTQATIFSPQTIAMMSDSPIREFIEKNAWSDFGDRIRDRDFMVDWFERHNAAVRAEIPTERLLVYDVSQGWGPLCDFLAVPVPSTPFPRINSREEMTHNLEELAGDGSAPQFDMAKVQEMIKARLATSRPV